MELHGKIHTLPKTAKLLIGFFIVTLSFGYFTGLRFVNENTNNTTQGIEEHYLGNEAEPGRKIFIEIWKAVRMELLGLEVCEPRIWQT